MKLRIFLSLVLTVAGVAVFFAACSNNNPAAPSANTASTSTPTFTVCTDSGGHTCTPTFSFTPTPTGTATATRTPTVTRTHTPCGFPGNTCTPAGTSTHTPTPVNTPLPTSTPFPCPLSPPPFTLAWGGGSPSSAAGSFNYMEATCIALDDSGNVYVADDFYDSGLILHDRVQKFSSTGSYLGTVVTLNSQGVIGLAVDHLGYLYVGNDSSSNITKYDPFGKPVTQWGTLGTGSGQFDGPGGLAVDSANNVYVHDWRNYRIQKFTSNGAFLGRTTGSVLGYFNGPGGMAVDADGSIYVVSGYNSEVEKMDSNFNPVTVIGYNGPGGGLSSPWAVAVDGRGFVYVADTNAHRVQMFKTDATFCQLWGSNGSGNGMFSYPQGVAATSTGEVYVEDIGNYRVQAFRP